MLNYYIYYYCTIMCGADISTAKVATIVKNVNTNKQNLQEKWPECSISRFLAQEANTYLSTTIAANFQSLIISASSSAFLIRAVINCNSLSMWWRSLCWQPDIEWCSSSVEGREKLKNWDLGEFLKLEGKNGEGQLKLTQLTRSPWSTQSAH